MNDRTTVGSSILVVEDDVVAASDLQARLISFGYAVQLVASAEHALAAIEATTVDLVLLSLLLPDTDGLILCSSLKARTAAPIIVLSERPREVDRLLAMALGASDFLAKPLDFDDLRGRIAAVIVDQTHCEPVGRAH
jgi:DNA-binding response OmpR family regulator